MRHILFLLFMAFTLQAIAQYPATGNKMRLGWQTTGDGLVYRGAIGDTATLDPSGINNAWMLLDTANGNLYAYRAKAWRLVSGGGGGGGLTMPFDSVTFNVNETDASLRELKYSEEKGYLQYGGQDSVQIPLLPGIWYVRNDTSVTIPKGTVLRATGTLGASGRIKVKHMIANGSIDAMYILGIAMQDIAIGADGYVMTQGKIRQINTQAYSEGAVLYADVDTLGGLTQTKPTGSNLKLPIAFVVHSASNGTLAVRVSPGTYLRDLHDAYITSPDSSASLYYNKSEGIWRDTGAAVLVADTSAMLTNYINVVDTAAMLTNYINVADTATMLSSYISNADTSVFARDFQISGTSGQVTYFNGSNTVTGDANLTWSAANKTLGINTTTTSGANIIIKNTQEPIRDAAWLPQQTFGADTTNWTAGTGWTFNGTQAVATAATGALTYTTLPDTIISGRAYEVTYTLAGYSAGTVTVAVGNATLALPAYNVTANAVLLTPTSATGGFRFTTSTFTGNLDNVAVVEVRNPAPVLLAGQDDGAAILYNSLRMPNSSTLAFGGGGANSTGTNNNFFGPNSGLSNTTGTNNNFFGPSTGRLNTSGFSNNFFGSEAGRFNSIGFSNNFFGNSAGLNNTTGSSNNFFGAQAGRDNSSGANNNIFGNLAGIVNTTGSNNNFFGTSAGSSNTTGSNNIFFGNLSGAASTTANNNVFFGPNSGRQNTTGNSNIFFGLSAGFENRTGGGNVFFGQNTGYNTTLADTLTGSNNTAIGFESARNIASSAAGNLVLGNSVNLPTGNGSNQVVIKNLIFGTGASGTGTTIAAGSRVGIKTNAPASDFHVAGEVRIDDLKPTGTPRNIVGSSSTGDLSTMAWGNGLTVSVGDTILRVDTSVILPKVNVSGTANYLAKFTAGSTVGNSPLYNVANNQFIIGHTASGTGAKNTLEIRGTGNTDFDGTKVDLYVNSSGQDYHAPIISLRRSRSATAGAFTKANDLDWLGQVIFNGADGDEYTGGALIRAIVDGTTGNNDMPASLLFATTPDGSSTQTERMRITSAGNVGIATASPSRPLHVAGTTAIRIPVGNFAERGTSGAGDIRVRSDTANLEFHNGTSWQTVATQSYVTDNAISTVFIPINLYAPGDTVANTTNSKAFFLVHSGLNGYCIDSYTVKAFSGSGTADIQIDKNGTGGNLQAISGTTTATKDTNIALATGDYIRGQVFNLSGTLVGLGLTLEIKKTCN